jgi:hypothetical protein
MEHNVLLEPLFGGGNQSTAPSQQPSSGQSSGSTPTSGETSGGETTTAPPAAGSQADPIYDEEPGEGDDGTYDNVPPANSEEGGTVDQPVETTPSDAEASEPAPVTDETPEATPAPNSNESGVQPEPASEPNAPTGSTPEEQAPEAAEPAPSTGTPSQPQASEPIESQPEASAPQDTVPAPTQTEPTTAPAPSSPVAATPSPAGEAAPVADATEESETLRDFVTPFLADLETIRQRQASGTSDARAESRNRAVAAIQDQLTSRLLDELSSEKASTRSATLLDDTKAEAAAKPLSLVERWYAEA